jgi:hypothetical protein
MYKNKGAPNTINVEPGMAKIKKKASLFSNILLLST